MRNLFLYILFTTLFLIWENRGVTAQSNILRRLPQQNAAKTLTRLPKQDSQKYLRLPEYEAIADNKFQNGKADHFPTDQSDKLLFHHASNRSILPKPEKASNLLDHLLPEQVQKSSVSQETEVELLPLDEELWKHGGSHMYVPGGHLGEIQIGDKNKKLPSLLPVDWQAPRPLTYFADFLGADQVEPEPHFYWSGKEGYQSDLRFVGYGSYQVQGFVLSEGSQEQNALGHQLLLELDLRITGTERVHVQFRPLGDGNSGGSFYQFNQSDTYVNNGTGEPQRYWIEGEIHSLFGPYLDPFAPNDIHLTAGKFPLALHNNLLLNDEIIGVAVTKNNLYVGANSNANLLFFLGINDIEAYTDSEARMYGAHIAMDKSHGFTEATYTFLEHTSNSHRSSHYLALSHTTPWGLSNLAFRSIFKFGDEQIHGGLGNGQLFVIESNRDFLLEAEPLCIHHVVAYANLFWANDGWSPISGGNFNRLRSTFETNPLVRISSGRPTENVGLSIGGQFFRNHDDESISPEFSLEFPEGDLTYGVALRYQKKTGPRSFFEVAGVWNESNNSLYRRKGLFLSQTIIF